MNEKTPPSHGGDHFATQGPNSAPSSSPNSPEIGADAFATGGMIANSSQELTPGQRITSRYIVVKSLGSGGMGQVYLVQDTLRNQEVALKRLHPHLASDPKLQQRFLEEIKIAERLVHPGFLKILGVDQDADRGELFYLMEYLPGKTLEVALKERGDQPFSLQEAIRLLKPLGEALDALHQMGVIHRDLKPSNIYLPDDGHPRLMDLGIARILQEPGKHTLPTNAGIGTAYYMAPEQLRGQTISTASDIFSFGVLAYEMLTGQLPIGIPKPPSRLVSTLSQSIDQILFQALDADPHERPSSAGKIVASLEIAQAPKRVAPPVSFAPPSTPPPSAPSPSLYSAPTLKAPAPPKKKSVWLRIFLAIFFIVLLGLAALGYLLYSSAPPPPPDSNDPFGPSAPSQGNRRQQPSPEVPQVPQQQVPQQQVPQQQVPQQQVPQQQVPQVPNVPLVPQLPQAPTPPREGGQKIPVQVVLGDYASQVKIEIRGSKLDVYPGSSFYRIQGVLSNAQADSVLWHVRLQLELLDQQGRVLAQRNVQGVETHEPPLCHLDANAFKHLERTTPQVRKARLTVTTVQKPRFSAQRRPYCKRPLIPLTLKWETEPPENIRATVQERPHFRPKYRPNRFIQRAFGAGRYHYFHWVVENTGKEPIRLLQLGATFYNKAGQVIKLPSLLQRTPELMKTTYAVTSDEPSLQPGEKRIAGTMAKLPRDYSHYTITVIDIR
ncbi:MAG: serine/threonine protein kinase [Myxococcales bacterium]|nr:serine/threonine protein kinase [Myxococcales bacterium]